MLRPVVRESAYQHEKRLFGSDLLINRLVAFNFRPPLIFPNRELARAGGYFQ
jgi:hypothetical protein